MLRFPSRPLLSATLSSSCSSLLVALLPKCPVCLMMLLAPLGIKLPGSRWFLEYAVAMLAAIPLAFFLTPACRRCGLRPLLFALAGLAVITIGRLAADSLVLVAVGVLAMVAAAIFTVRPAEACGK